MLIVFDTIRSKLNSQFKSHLIVKNGLLTIVASVSINDGDHAAHHVEYLHSYEHTVLPISLLFN